jgi:anti-sigma factor RsiW
MVTDYLEGKLAPPDHHRFETHLTGCPHCKEYLDQIQETIRLSGRLTPDDLTPQMHTDLTDIYRRWRAEGEPGR